MCAVVIQGKDALAPMDGMDALMEAVALENQRSRPLPDEDFDDDEMEPSTAGSPLGKTSLLPKPTVHRPKLKFYFNFAPYLALKFCGMML